MKRENKIKSTINDLDTNILKYRSGNLIILYCCTYSGLLNTVRVVIWNFMGLMKNTEFGS